MKIFLEALILFFLIIIFAYLLFYPAGTLLAPGLGKGSQAEICYGGNCILAEIAQTPFELENGLMHRKKLDKNKGMFFIFGKEGSYPFWMKNTLIPLDMIWINKNSKVVFVKENAQLCTENYCPQINPEADAKYVLEVNAGVSKNMEMKIGSELKITISY
jgi:uncharacterized protein